MMRGGRTAVALFLSWFCAGGVAVGDVFNMGGLKSIVFRLIRAVDAPGDPAGTAAGGHGPARDCGVVLYDFRMDMYEVTVAQYAEFLNKVAKTDDPHNLYATAMQNTAEPVRGCGIIRTTVAGVNSYSYAAADADRPVNYVSWGDAARFCNWLHHGQPEGVQDATTTEDGAYTLLGAMTEPELLDAVVTPIPYFFLPTEDEWHKAAYYDGRAYFLYPTSSSVTPSNAIDVANSANYQINLVSTLGGVPWRTPVGAFTRSASPYGTFDQAGNVWEWIEDSAVFGAEGSPDCEDPAGRCKLIRGGAFNTDFRPLHKAWRDVYNPARERYDLGFRVGAQPPGIIPIDIDPNPIDPDIFSGLQGGVGGISINADGVLQNASLDELGKLRKLRRMTGSRVPSEIYRNADQRKVSLRGIEEIAAQCVKRKRPLPAVVKYLCGLQRIEYVFVYPEKQDIVLVGPGEGWKVDDRGNVVGIKSGRPVLLLDDLVIALRSARQAAQGGISCSIDPTQEGLVNLRKHVQTLATIGNPAETAAGIERALGVQQISVNNVPGTSHFAHVMVAADYRMKRIAMGFEPAPVKGLPSFLRMITASGKGMSNMLPRWWLEPKYEPLLRDEEGLAWQLRGGRVEVMTEEDFLAASGEREQTGKAHPMAKKWADNMTAKYAELAIAEPVFGDVENCMELAIVAALLFKERLLEKAQCSLPTLLDSTSLAREEYPVPKAVDSKATVLKKGRNWIISASGGVLINSWQIVDKTEKSDEPTKVRQKSAAGAKQRWFWN